MPAVGCRTSRRRRRRRRHHPVARAARVLDRHAAMARAGDQKGHTARRLERREASPTAPSTDHGPGRRRRLAHPHTRPRTDEWARGPSPRASPETWQPDHNSPTRLRQRSREHTPVYQRPTSTPRRPRPGDDLPHATRGRAAKGDRGGRAAAEPCSTTPSPSGQGSGRTRTGDAAGALGPVRPCLRRLRHRDVACRRPARALRRRRGAPLRQGTAAGTARRPVQAACALTPAAVRAAMPRRRDRGGHVGQQRAHVLHQRVQGEVAGRVDSQQAPPAVAARAPAGARGLRKDLVGVLDPHQMAVLRLDGARRPGAGHPLRADQLTLSAPAARQVQPAQGQGRRPR
jgi:hypothetical protein